MSDRAASAGTAPDVAAQRQCDGATIAYRIARAPDGAGRPAPALVLLHGLASNLSRWAEFVTDTALRGRWTLLRVDLRGHGGSQSRTRVSLERWSDDLMAILDGEGIDRAVFAGHSLGAQVALAAAAWRPVRVAGLVLIDPVLRHTLHGRLARYARAAPLFHAAATVVRAANALGLHRGALAPLDLQVLDRAARVALRSPAAEAEFIRRYSSAFADLSHVPTAIYLQDLVELFRTPPPLAQVTQPSLVLLSRGATFSAFDASRAALAHLPRAQIVAIDCHHWPLTERPMEVRTAIDAWCLGTWAGGPGAL